MASFDSAPGAVHPVLLIVYHLPPPPPGFLYAFTTISNSCGRVLPPHVMPPAPSQPFIPFFSPAPPPHPFPAEGNGNVATPSKLPTPYFDHTLPPAAADCNQLDRLTSSSDASAAAYDNSNADSSVIVFDKDSNSVDRSQQLEAGPWPAGTFACCPSNVEKYSTSTITRKAHHHEQLDIHRHSLDSAFSVEAPADQPIPPRFWCNRRTGFSRPQFCVESDERVSKWGDTTSTLCSSTMTLDEAVAQNKRFNKTPSFRNKKYVRTNSQNGSLLGHIPESSSGSCDPSSTQGETTLMSKRAGQRRITEFVWRVKDKPKEVTDRSDSTPDSTSQQIRKDADPPKEEMTNSAQGFAFGVKAA